MLTVKEFMELVDYRITEGSEYCWSCFGSDAYSLGSWNGDHNGFSFNIVFDTQTQTVYTVEVCDYARDRAYRMINPDYKQAHDDEARDRGIDAKQAWDTVNYVDLEVDDDFIQKGLAIRDGVDYDTRVDVPLNLPDDVLFTLMKRAHEQDITLNELVEQVLWEAIRNEKSVNETDDDTFLSPYSGSGPLDSQYPDGDGYWRDEEMASDLQEMREEYDFSEGIQSSPAKIKSKKKKKK